MTADQLASLKQDARYIFYHGLTNYHKYAWPEDELRPLTCGPLARDRANPAHIEVNDVLGNYSLSVVDSLSTLAILASSSTSAHDEYNALDDFQRYISLLVEQYGDGSSGATGQGLRARGFDLDSKVQLFETTIRGLGGLLSAHLFAMGDLPIRGYIPDFQEMENGKEGMKWNVTTSAGEPFVYDGQLLRLALDLGKRLLPAFHTPTGIPYPRVNLRTGIPFYENSPLNNDAEHGQCDVKEPPKSEREITETCSAGAGSLVLEFSVLSRLTGDERFEKLAKKAFWAVWERRTSAGLIGSGIDAETGQWISPYTGIGAGIDSFFEYAFKSHILLSGLERYDDEADQDVSSMKFLDVWKEAHAAIKRHIYRGPSFQHPHYAQNDMWSGGPRLGWIDSLSAYYPGLLTLAGELEEATAAQLVYTALWTRYGALPERWNTFTGKIDAGLNWWGGRPEFIESNWYLYRATQDPWYLHVGEMTIKDIKRRCWTACGWGGLQDVQTGQLTDRMESFFLGETAKYLYLLFDKDHPLNHLDAPFVFTTEGHPLIIPDHYKPHFSRADADPVPSDAQCPVPPSPSPLTFSAVAMRPDIFHAASLARLHEIQTAETQPFEMMHDHFRLIMSPFQATNRSFYPWTLPNNLIPPLGKSSKMAIRHTFDLTFPTLPSTIADFGALSRIENGILIKSISGLRLALVLDDEASDGGVYRVHALSGLALGRDEGLWFSPSVLTQLNPTDPHLSHMKDTDSIDLILDVPVSTPPAPSSSSPASNEDFNAQLTLLAALPAVLLSDGPRLAAHLESLAEHSMPDLNLDHAFRAAAHDLRTRPVPPPAPAKLERWHIPAMLPFGPGAAPLPSIVDSIPDPASLGLGSLTFRSILAIDGDLCSPVLPASIPRRYEILLIRRGGCAFSDKLGSIPAFPPVEGSLKLVVVVGKGKEGEEVHRPFLHVRQVTPGGVERRNAVPLVLVHAEERTWEVLRRAAGGVATRRYWFACNGVRIANLHVA
ncbi:glycoside hydrolase family 47 protein [Myriangium duriaei CBS 260.36]|uniref:alpha-1,2-Mannosidase n=1 Tax=Myriangium duriaei CBS 260.36 TaxID=1168546 RepID=A0A9P4J3H7_9PEZI|nr:glycoside hydrolase family 47 protein [Myriangium duriaei CBS 260.36]